MPSDKEDDVVRSGVPSGHNGGSVSTLPALPRLELPQHMRPAPSAQNLDPWPDSLRSESGEALDPYSQCQSSASAFPAASRDSPGMADFEGCTMEDVALAPVHLQECLVEDLELIATDTEDPKRSLSPFSVMSEDEPTEDTQLTHKEMVRLKWKRLTWPLAIFLLIGLLFIWVARGHLFQVLNWLAELPWLERLIVFIVLFTMVSLPFGFGYIILNMMAGYLYGVVEGQLVVMVSVAIGFSLAFHLCRSWLQDYAKNMVTSTSLQAVMRVVEGPHGLKVIILTRLTPIPFGLQNVLFSVSSLGSLVIKVHDRSCSTVCGGHSIATLGMLGVLPY